MLYRDFGFNEQVLMVLGDKLRSASGVEREAWSLGFLHACADPLQEQKATHGVDDIG